jgi:ribose transport system substrate-binding protein
MNKLKRKGFFGRFSAMALSIAMLAALPSCGPDDISSYTKTGKIMVIGREKPENANFWREVENGSKDAGKELGYTVKFQASSSSSDVSSQEGFIDEAIKQKYDVIVIAPNSSKALNEKLKEAVDAGIKIINIESSCTFDDVQCLITSSDGAAASTCCDELMRILLEKYDKISGVGKIGIIGHNEESADQRITVFKNRVANEIMIDNQRSGQSISGGQAAETDSNGVVAVLEDGTELLAPEEAANRAAEAASKQGLKGDEITRLATEAAQEAANLLKQHGYDPGQAPGQDSNTDPAENMQSPDDAAQEALEAAKKDPNITPDQYGSIAQAAAEKAAAAIEKAREEAGYDPSTAKSDGPPVDKNGTPDPAYDMQTPAEAGQVAVDNAKKDSSIPPDQYSSIGQAAAQEQAEKIAKAREEAGYILSEEQAQEENSSSKGANYFQQLQDEYFVEGDRITTSFEAFEAALKLLDPDGDGKADETGINVLYATSAAATTGVCQAVEKLDLQKKIIVLGFNSDDVIISYLKTGTLSASIVQNPYSMGYLGVLYSKKLVDGDTITKKIDTGVTLVNEDNITDDYIQTIIHPGEDIEIAAADLKDKDKDKKSSSKDESAAPENAEKSDDAKNTEKGGKE